MEAFDGFQEKELDLLNEVILKAIISSPDVEKVLQHFKSKELINETAVVNLIVSLEELSGLIFSEQTDKSTQNLESPSENSGSAILKNNMEENTQKETSSNFKYHSRHHYVDGKILKRNEILFEKYFQGRFNEKQWLKRSKIKS
jgi:hypothetical protein